ncbi:GNAT family N-acetyltransferase [Amaricoccus sp.]|uniref:GNAT family N-acetyltransferase n=1 Tax=Amaricoccus sp. TaxID=1872485 RepID=UPI001B69FAD7|nr:GNAT family N-acetyltransferase [Amaricoccus sp.]MBP7001965.1 N-acetyltransferase [Amaricoccus sp.]
MAVDAAEVAYEDGGAKARYVYRAEGAEAELVLSKVGDSRAIIEHTEVPDVMRGMGVGQAMVARAVADARAAGKKILPLCPFAAAQFRRHPDWEDVLDRRG